MKAAVVPAVRSRWEVKEVPTPDPGPNQVLIDAETYKLGEVTKAYQRVAEGKVRFRAVIVK